MELIAVGIGGFMGAILRALCEKAIPNQNGFPIATVTINLVGCFILGFFLQKASQKKYWNKYVVAGISTGVIGGFTTFSTFTVETLTLFEHHDWKLGVSYVCLSVLGGILLGIFGKELAFKLGGVTS